jgi:hypothetical protein
VDLFSSPQEKQMGLYKFKTRSGTQQIQISADRPAALHNTQTLHHHHDHYDAPSPAIGNLLSPLLSRYKLNPSPFTAHGKKLG